MKKVALALTALVLLVTFVVGAEEIQRGGSVTVLVEADPDSFDPHKSVAAITDEIDYNLYEGLVGFDTKGNLTPALAESWEVSPDGRTYKFRIRAAHFHNGRRVTAEDVVYSFRRIMDPKTAFPHNWPNTIDNVSAENDNTVVITLKEASAPFLYYLPNAAIIPAEAVGTLANTPVGTGPFRFVEWKPNQHVKLMRFAKYWNSELPYLDEVVFRIMPDITTSLINLKTGDLDIIPRLDPELVQDVEVDRNLKIVAGPMNLVQLMAINNGRRPFNDVRVRRALNYAIDRDEIILGAAWGYGTKLGSGLSPVSAAFYNDLSNYYPYDPAKARELLREAGYPNGFEVTLTLPGAYQLHVRTGEIIAAQLAKVGIRANIEIVEWGTWLERVYAGRDYDLTVIGFTGKLDPHIALERYHSEYPRNFVNFRSPEYDRLMDAGKVEGSQARRVEIYKRAQEILAEEAAAVFIMDPSAITAMRKWVEGWQHYPLYVDDMKKVWRRE